MDFKDFFETIKNLPQSQKDLRTVAQTVDQLQDPRTVEILEQARDDMERYAYIQLGLQVLSTVAIFGVFMMALSRHSKGKGPA